MRKLFEYRVPAPDMAVRRIGPGREAVEVTIGDDLRAPIGFESRFRLKQNDFEIRRSEFPPKKLADLLEMPSRPVLLGGVE